MDDNLDMSIFAQNDDFEFNYDFDEVDDTIDENEKDIDPTKKITTVDGEDQEEVDGEEDEQDEGGDNDDDTTSSDDSSSNLYSSVAAVLYEQGLLPSLDIENIKIESPDDFAEAFRKELQIQSRAMAESYLDNLDIESIAQSKNEIKNLESITDDSLASNIEVAKQIVYQDYLNQGLDENKVKRLLTRLVDLGEDAILEEAKDSLGSLKEFHSRQIEDQKEFYDKQRVQQEQDQKKVDDEIKKNIFERKDLIKGYSLNKAIQDKVYKTMNEIVGKSPEGVFENKFMRDRRNNPIEFESRMYTIYELTNGFTDFSKVTTKGKSSAVNDLEKIIKKGAYKDTGSPTWMNDSNSYDIGIGDELNF